MRQESKATKAPAFAHIRKTAILVMSLLCSGMLSAQNRIDIHRYNFDQILITNPQVQSITLQIGNERQMVIPGRSFRQVPFSLSYQHVTRTPFIVSYDYNSFMEDSLICSSLARRNEKNNGILTEMTALVYALCHQGMQFEKFVVLMKVVALLLGVPTPWVDTLLVNLSDIWNSTNTNDQKEREMESIIKTYFDRSAEIEQQRGDCVSNARTLLKTIQPATYYAYQFIAMQEKSRFEITPFGIVGYRTKLFKGIGDKNTIERIDIGSHAYYGLRAAVVVNAYNKYHRRKIDTKYYFPVSVSKSPVVYKSRSYNDVFTANKGYSWLTYSLGFGWEFNYFNANHTKNTSSAFLDIGAVSSILQQYNRDSIKLSNATTVSSCKGVIPYLNVGYKIRITNWLDLYGAYYTTFLYSSLKYDKKDMPSFRQFNVGLNFNIARHFSYQY